jgi:hypothetical protein
MARMHGVATLMMGMCVTAAMAQQPAPAGKPTAAPSATKPSTGQPSAAQPSKEKPTAAQPGGAPGMGDLKLTPEQMADMKVCMEAGTPGPNHEFLAKGIGTWEGKSKMWMSPEAAAIESPVTTKISSVMDGRFTKCEVSGDMPGMGAFNGYGLYGFDNTAQKFQSVWIDNCGTGMMVGTGELSSDQKTMTWTYTYTCPIQKKQVTMREVERWTGPNAMTMEMYGQEPHTGKEFKMMEIACTRKAGGETNLGGARSDAAPGDWKQAPTTTTGR